jgi:hypothetical protein
MTSALTVAESEVVANVQWRWANRIISNLVKSWMFLWTCSLGNMYVNTFVLYSGDIIQIHTPWQYCWTLNHLAFHLALKHNPQTPSLFPFPILRVLVANEKSSWPCEWISNSKECFSELNLMHKNMSSRFYNRHWMGLLTVSKASEYVDAIVAAVRAKGSRGALFWASRAIWNILFNDEEYFSRPKDTEWKDSAFLHSKSENQWIKNVVTTTNPRRTAARHRSWTVWSLIALSPSDRNIITGVLDAHVNISQINK